MPPIHIVYFINTLVNDTYPFLFSTQMNDLFSTRILDETHAHLHIEMVASPQDFRIHEILKNIFGEKYQSKITTTVHVQNNYEYPGLDRVWRLGQNMSKNDEIILYFHSKGISWCTYDETKNRDALGTYLFDVVIRPWKKIMDIFRDNPGIDKIGHSPSPSGWIWYNFFWIRGTFAQQLERPIITSRRHYYEDYVCRKPRIYNDVFFDRNRPEIQLNHDDYDLTCANCMGLAKPDAWSP